MNIWGSLSNAPNVRTEAPARERTISDVMDGDQHRNTARATRHSPVNGCLGDSTRQGEGCGTVARGELDSHDSKSLTFYEESKGKLLSSCEIAQIEKITHHIPVSRSRIPRQDDVWPQRLFVMGRIDAEIASGVNIEELAKDFGMDTTSSIEVGWRYNYDRKPHMHTVVKIAKRLGLTVREVYDPEPPPTADDEELDLAKKFIAKAAGSERADRLTDEQVLASYRTAIDRACKVVSAYLDD